MSMLFAYMAGREGVRELEVLKCFDRGSEGVKKFSTCFVCVCVGGGVRFSTSPSVKKITDPPPINK